MIINFITFFALTVEKAERSQQNTGNYLGIFFNSTNMFQWPTAIILIDNFRTTDYKTGK